MLCRFYQFVLKWNLQKFPLVHTLTETHIHRCLSCRNLAETYTETENALREAVSTEKHRTYNPDRCQRIMQAVIAEQSRVNTEYEQSPRFTATAPLRLKLIGAGAVSVILVSLGIAFVASTTSETGKTTKANAIEESAETDPFAFSDSIQVFTPPFSYATMAEEQLTAEARCLITDFRVLYDHFTTLPGSDFLFRPAVSPTGHASEDPLQEG